MRTLFPGRFEAIMSSRYLEISSLTFLRPFEARS
jgi:hypothetical protein